MKKFFFLSLIAYHGSLFAYTVDVRVLSTMNVTTVNIFAHSGKYALYFNGTRQVDSLCKKVFQLVLDGDSIDVLVPGDTLGKICSFRLLALDDTSSFKIKPVKPLSGTRLYDHSLTVTVFNGCLRCINTVDLEHYVAGVVESEAGARSPFEFYEVQAIICRTYALAHLGRHAAEGFDLCDGVHCEAYRGRPNDPMVQKAVDATSGLVLVDKNLDLIVAAFHSNCGGQTANSEDVWAVALPYLRSVRDTFCIHMPNAHWQRKIARDDWLNYLLLKHKYPVDDSAAAYKAMNMTQDSRGTDYVYGNVRIPYKTIRSDWQLRSAYFSIEERKDSIIFIGRGYGHGVGLCQEGAMRMAALGYSYDQILNFYYRDIEIVSLSKLDFFRGE